MSAASNVIELCSASRVDAAWSAYAVEARKLIDCPTLIADRAFNELLARKHRAWLQLFYMQEAG